MKQLWIQFTVARLVAHSYLFIVALAGDDRASRLVACIVGWQSRTKRCDVLGIVLVCARPQRGPLMGEVSICKVSLRVRSRGRTDHSHYIFPGPEKSPSLI